MIYLATPYTHPDEAVREQRYHEALLAVKWLLREHMWVYSPIVHCHHLATCYRLPHDAKFWWDYNSHMLSRADELMVLALEGWQDSMGVAQECDFAYQLNKPVRFMTPTASYDKYEVEE
jgi:Domain of unknown function (DUF1937)